MRLGAFAKAGILGRGGVALLLIAALVFPLLADNYEISVGTGILTYAVLGLGLNIVVGYAGLLDLGYAAFFAIGAYAAGLLTTKAGFTYWETVPASMLLAGLSGIVVGYPTLRLRSDYLAIVTLGFGEIIRITATNLDYTGGPDGIWGIPHPVFFGYRLSTQRDFFYLVLGLLVLTLYFVRRLAVSRLGRAWLGLREDEDAAEAVGVPALRVKLLAYIMGALWAGLAGGFFATRLGVVNPQSFTYLQSVLILIVVVLGGMGSIPGVILGAAVVVGLPEVLRSIQGWRMLAFSLGLVVLMLARPQGLWPMRGRKVAVPRESPRPARSEIAAPETGYEGPLLEVEGLRCSFGGLVAVDDVGFAVRRGELLSIIGPNGAGKTTVFNAITGVVAPERGAVRLAGVPLIGRAPHAVVEAGLARTFQGIRLFRSLTALDNVLIGMHPRLAVGVVGTLLHAPHVKREEAAAAATGHFWLDFVGLAGKAGHIAGELPYGDQRRLEIARALASRPLLLLLDEPAAGMNPSEKGALMRLVARIRELGTTIILIEHDMNLVMRVSDRVIVLDRGRCIASGPPDAVQADERVIDAYLGRDEAEAEAVEAPLGPA
ncbi:MAG TPA: ATP-binding cassette domain-containing protein [Stellaceae bacterium]|nr:ATP-binding cassette domain-containing protein [Stellaceae bacterium]